MHTVVVVVVFSCYRPTDSSTYMLTSSVSSLVKAVNKGLDGV